MRRTFRPRNEWDPKLLEYCRTGAGPLGRVRGEDVPYPRELVAACMADVGDEIRTQCEQEHPGIPPFAELYLSGLSYQDAKRTLFDMIPREKRWFEYRPDELAFRIAHGYGDAPGFWS